MSSAGSVNLRGARVCLAGIVGLVAGLLLILTATTAAILSLHTAQREAGADVRQRWLVVSTVATSGLSLLMVSVATAFAWRSRRNTLHAAIHEEDGQAVVRCNAHSIMEPRRSDAALHTSAARFDGIISSAMDAIVSIDSQQRIVLFNPAAEKMFGVSAAEVVGQNLSRLIPQRFREAHTRHVEDFGKTGVSARRMGALGTISGLRADGQEFPIEAAISQIGVGADKLFTVILRDITERKRAEEALRQGQEQLRRANRELTDFATIVSHDLKAPLRAVATLATWLQSDYADKLDDEGRENLVEMGKRVRRLDWMIDGILEYSLIGRARDNPEPVALADLVSGVVQDLAPPAHVHVHVAPYLPVVHGEPVRLRQVFQNLIANGIKYGNKPQIEVRVEWADQGSFWEFRVADNGPGIEQRHFERIFGMFQTLAPKDKTDSTGVGLALVKRIVERAGGRVWVESQPGQGSTFHFTWPKVPPTSAGGEVTTVVQRHEPSEPQPSSASPSGGRS